MAAVAAPASSKADAVPCACAQHNSKLALTPPTSEEWNKDEGSASDALSDLELEDDEEEEEIEPDHYYEGGRIPVFKPTMDQFKSFKSYIDKIDKYGMKSGIVKVIPPKEWRNSLPPLDEAVKGIRVKNPITQEFSGVHGTYTQANIEKQRSYNLPQWKSLTQEAQHQPPARRGEKRRHQEKVARPAPKTRPVAAAEPSDASAPKRRPGRPRKNPLPPPLALDTAAPADDEDSLQAPLTPTSPTSATKAPERPKRKVSDTASIKIKQEVDPAGTTPNKPKARGRQPKSNGPKSISERRKYNRQEKADQIDEAAFEWFDYRFEDSEEFTAERCNELETQYWKSLTFAPPMYGADMPGSLFDDSTTSWNVSKLENLLDVLGQRIPGVNTAYLYLGMWKATFAWHLEDVDLYSINYIHFGAPKQWYSISQEDARRFENAMKTIWPNDAKNCSQFLRHKTYLISPALLKTQFNIEVNRLVHYEGEFVITYPYGYHSGYNLGYNCAESVNFATEAWLDYGRIAKKCDCEADSVWVNVDDIERKLRGEPTPEYYEETDDDDNVEEAPTDLPSPPASVAGKPKAQSRKRKRDPVAAQPTPHKVKKLKIRIRTSTIEPCVLCPHNPSAEQLLPTDTGRLAHRMCALYTPETYIWEENGVETVRNVADIDKARLELKCSFCRSRKGACFQCSSRKCTRAFHATCAAPAGVQVDYGPTPVYGEDGTEYISEGNDFRCRFHRAKRPKNTLAETLEASSLVRKFARALQAKDVVQVQYLQGEVFAGTVVENRPFERALVIDILPDGDRVEIEWKWISVLDPAESQLPKPTADAKPLPAHMTGQVLTDRNLEYGPPLAGDHFCDPDALQKWAEFHTAPAPHNAFQVKVDMDKDKTLWFYLGRTSTEARAHFTEDLAKQRNNPAGNFLETVKPAVPPPPPAPRRSYPAAYQSGVNYHALNGAMAVARQQSMQQQQLDQPARPYNYKPKSATSPPADGQMLQQTAYFSQPQSSFAHAQATPPASFQASKSMTSDMLQLKGDWGGSGNPASDRRTSFNSLQYTPQMHSFSNGWPSSNKMQHSAGMQIPTQKWNAQQLGSQTLSRNMPPKSHPQPVGMAPMANMTPQPNPKEPVEWPQESKECEFLKRIQSYKYLVNSYCRRPTVYASPYAADEGFSDEYTKMLPKQGPVSDKPTPSHYQECSIPMTAYAPAAYQVAKGQMRYQPQNNPVVYPISKRSNYGQYQTAQQFEQEVQKEAGSQQSAVPTCFDRLFAQMNTAASEFSPVEDENQPHLHLGHVEPRSTTLGFFDGRT